MVNQVAGGAEVEEESKSLILLRPLQTPHDYPDLPSMFDVVMSNPCTPADQVF